MRKSGLSAFIRVPFYLCVEALAELDPDRRADLLASLASVEQTLLTTTDMALFSAQFVQQATVWKVNEGRVEGGGT